LRLVRGGGSMRVLCRPTTSAELAVVESLLNAEHVQYFVHNEHFGGMEIGPQIPMVNERTVLVREEDYERAAGLVATPPSAPHATPTNSPVSMLGKLRMAVELLLFGWLIPARRSHRNVDNE
jgi:hypothetical protein